MAKDVAAAATDDRDIGIQRAEEGRGARCSAAVMRHLEHAQRRRLEGCGEVPFHVLSDVAREDERHAGISNLEHDGIVVPHPLAFPFGFVRMPHKHVDRTESQHPAWPCDPPRNAFRLGRAVDQPHRFMPADGNAFPDFARTEVFEQAQDTPDVIRIPVRDGQVVDSPNAGRPERRRYHSASEIESASRKPAGIHDERSSAWKLNQCRIALADIEECDPQQSIVRADDRRHDDPDHADDGAHTAQSSPGWNTGTDQRGETDVEHDEDER